MRNLFFFSKYGISLAMLMPLTNFPFQNFSMGSSATSGSFCFRVPIWGLWSQKYFCSCFLLANSSHIMTAFLVLFSLPLWSPNHHLFPHCNDIISAHYRGWKLKFHTQTNFACIFYSLWALNFADLAFSVVLSVMAYICTILGNLINQTSALFCAYKKDRKASVHYKM